MRKLIRAALDGLTSGKLFRRVGKRQWLRTLEKQRGRLVDRHAAALDEAASADKAANDAKRNGDHNGARLERQRERAARGEAAQLQRRIERKNAAIDRAKKAAATALIVMLGGCAHAHDLSKATAKGLIIAGEGAQTLCEAKEPAPVGCGSPECVEARRKCLRLPWELDETREIVDALIDTYEGIDLWIQTGSATGNP